MLNKKIQKFLSTAPDHIRRALDGKRLSPGFVPKWYPVKMQEFTAITPSSYVSEYGIGKETQEKILSHLGVNPLNGYSFYGPTGTGKTFLLYALSQEVIRSGRRVMFFTATELVDMLRRSQFCEVDGLGDMPKPSGLPGFPVHVFIDEIDQTPTTDFSLRAIFDILNHCYNMPSSVVLSVSSNLVPSELGKIIGPASMRRIEAVTNSIKLGVKNGY